MYISLEALNQIIISSADSVEQYNAVRNFKKPSSIMFVNIISVTVVTQTKYCIEMETKLDRLKYQHK